MHSRFDQLLPARDSHRPNSLRRRAFRPRVEGLEDRCLLTLTEFPLPVANSFPLGISADETNLWYTTQGPFGEARVGVNDTAGYFFEFETGTFSSRPSNITLGPDGNLWFTLQINNQIGMIDSFFGFIVLYDLPGAGLYPTSISPGADGNLWFTTYFGNAIGKITPAGAVTLFPLPQAESYPAGITLGFDGNLWFTEYGRNRVGRITPAGVITEFAIPTANSQPVGIAGGWDGRMWFTETGANKIGAITLDGSSIVEYPIPTANSFTQALVQGYDGNLWFTETRGNKFGRITHDGVVTEFVIPTANSEPTGITVGPDFNIWFVETGGNKLARWVFDDAAPGGGGGGGAHDPGLVPLLQWPATPRLTLPPSQELSPAPAPAAPDLSRPARPVALPAGEAARTSLAVAEAVGDWLASDPLVGGVGG